MRVIIDDLELQGTGFEILTALAEKKREWDGEKMSLTDFFAYMCKTYYQNTGEQIVMSGNLEVDSKTLFDAMAENGDLKYL